MNFYNNIPLNCFNTLVTDAAKFSTYFQIAIDEPISEQVFVWVNPETYYYGVDGKQYSCMTCIFYDWNKMLLEMGLTDEQMTALNDNANTRLNFSHREGYRSAAKFERMNQRVEVERLQNHMRKHNCPVS